MITTAVFITCKMLNQETERECDDVNKNRRLSTNGKIPWKISQEFIVHMCVCVFRNDWQKKQNGISEDCIAI